MIKFRKDEFMRPLIYSTNDEYETGCHVTDEVVNDITNLQQELTKYKERCEKVVGYINNYDVFAEFSFPLMKRDEENQVKSSIEYEFDTSIKKSLLEILEDKENKNDK